MANCMRAAARHGVRVVVCDRPNPIGGDAVEGGVLREQWTSFVGQFPIPLRHGMTIGELARLFNDAFGIGCALDVVSLAGWRRSMYFDQTGLPWVITSPNLPTLDTAIVYPGAVMFEGTMLSEGRGTTRPFELVGAPWIDGERLADADERAGIAGSALQAGVLRADLPQARARDVRWVPAARNGSSHIRAREDRRRNDCRVQAAGSRAFRLASSRRTSTEHDKQPIDVLYGSDQLRLTIDRDGDVDALVQSWEPEEEAFRQAAPALCY